MKIGLTALIILPIRVEYTSQRWYVPAQTSSIGKLIGTVKL